MSTEKQTFVSLIEIIPSGVVQVKISTVVADGEGNAVSVLDGYQVIAPGQDYSGEDARVQAICAAIHTADVISAYQAAIAAQGV